MFEAQWIPAEQRRHKLVSDLSPGVLVRGWQNRRFDILTEGSAGSSEQF